jgi:exportin-1
MREVLVFLTNIDSTMMDKSI